MGDDEDDSEITKLTLSYIEHKTMNETAEYLARGRACAALSAQELGERWVIAFHIWADDFSQGRDMNDLRSEMTLRGVEPPYDRITDRLNSITKGLSLRDIPEEGREAFARDFEAFLEDRDKPSA